MSMIYGYTRICSESGINGKESETSLYTSRKERDHFMYENYSDSFDAMEATGTIDGVDSNGNQKQTEEEFMEEIKISMDVEHDVFGLIQASDYHVQFEPFCKTVS